MNELVRYDAMCRAIDAAYEVDEVKDIRDKARAWETYARQAQNMEAERKACEIRLRAERKAGQLLADMGRTGKSRANQHAKSDDPTLQDLGVSKQQSSDWQKLANVPDDEFEAALADKTAIPTTAGIIRANSEPNPVSNAALWLWGRLLDFERNGMLEAEPGDVLESMTPEMLNDVHVLAPRVAAWLRRIGELRSDERSPKVARSDFSDYRASS